MFNMVIFGPPGCGKGTQSKMIVDEFGYLHVSSGDIIRKEIRNGTAIGQLFEKFISRGLLVPDEIIMKEIFRYWLKNMRMRGMVFDGFPRNLYQAQMMDRIFEKKEEKIEFVISIDVPEKELVRRVLERGKDSGRSDDNVEVMHNRLLVYQSQTAPVIDYYKKNNKLFSVDGQRSVDNVYAEIKQIILSKKH